MGTMLFWFISNPILRHIKEEEEKYRSLFEGANDIILIIDVKTFNILDVNTQATMQLSYTLEEFLNLTFGKIYPHNDDNYIDIQTDQTLLANRHLNGHRMLYSFNNGY